MLVLSRKPQETILIGSDIAITILGVQGSKVRVGVEAPPTKGILRAELAGEKPRKLNTRHPRMLIVDDSPEDRLTFRRFLAQSKGWEWDFSETGSGEEGLDLCRIKDPDCVLLDYHLPDLEGLEFLGRLREQPHGTRIPVIMVTGEGSEAVAVRAMKIGAVDYLVKKDISPKTLQATVQQAINKSYGPGPF